MDAFEKDRMNPLMAQCVTSDLWEKQFEVGVPLVDESEVRSVVDDACLHFNQNVRNIHIESIHTSGVIDKLRKCFMNVERKRNLEMIRSNRDRIETFRKLRKRKKIKSRPCETVYDFERRVFPSQNITELNRESVFFCDGCDEEHPIIGKRYNLVGDDFDICQDRYSKLDASSRAKFERADFGETYRLSPLLTMDQMPQKTVVASIVNRKTYKSKEKLSIAAPVLPPVSYIPSASAWICLKKSIRAEDEPVLRYIPFFGDDASYKTLDVSYFDVLPTDIGSESMIVSEVDESIALVCSMRWKNADDLFVDYICRGRGFKSKDLAERVKTRVLNMSKWKEVFPSYYGKRSFRAILSKWRCTLLSLEHSATRMNFRSSTETALSVPSLLSHSSWSTMSNTIFSHDESKTKKTFPQTIRVSRHPDVAFVGTYVRQLDLVNGKYWYKYRDTKGRHRRLYYFARNVDDTCWCLDDRVDEMGMREWYNGGWIKPDNDFSTDLSDTHGGGTEEIPLGSRRWNNLSGDGTVELIAEVSSTTVASNDGEITSSSSSSSAVSNEQFSEIWNGLRAMMESYRLLFCRRCFKFDCSIHGTQQPLTGTVGSPPSRPTIPSRHLSSNHPLRSLDNLRSTFSSSCCEKNCHKKSKEGDDGDGNERASKRRKKTDWTSREMLILLKSASIFGEIPIDPEMSCLDVILRRDRVCSVARCLPRFDCIEVKRKIEELALMYGSANGQLAKNAITSISSPKRGQRKKREDFSGNSSSTANSLSSKLLRLKRVMSKPGYNTKLYQPCFHPGEPCTKSNCSCVKNGIFCEKWCGCAPFCDKSFPGCKCKQGRCRSAVCICFNAGRECDPDKCLHCDAHLHPDEIVGERRCGNADIHYGNHGKLGLSASKIHGWGVFALQPFKKGEFIYEYIGEILSQNEADRRGKIYDQLNRSFLFNLNEFQVVDATRKGNKMKFANHSDTPNCRPLIRLTGGDHKIAIFAKRDIEVGEEICFDYRYNEDHAQVHFEKKKIAVG